MVERPLITIATVTIIGLGFLTYITLFLSPEKSINIWLFIAGLQIFLTGLVTLLIRLVKKTLHRTGGFRTRRVVSFAFVLALWPTLYLSLKVLGALTQLNSFLLLILILVGLLAILKNDQ